MIVENITQRSDEPFEVAENLALIRKHLKDTGVISADEKTLSSRGRMGEGRPTTIGIAEIHKWLNANGEVMEYFILKYHTGIIIKPIKSISVIFKL
jgi:hypothetical protein